MMDDWGACENTQRQQRHIYAAAWLLALCTNVEHSLSSLLRHWIKKTSFCRTVSSLSSSTDRYSCVDEEALSMHPTHTHTQFPCSSQIKNKAYVWAVCGAGGTLHYSIGVTLRDQRISFDRLGNVTSDLRFQLICDGSLSGWEVERTHSEHINYSVCTTAGCEMCCY